MQNHYRMQVLSPVLTRKRGRRADLECPFVTFPLPDTLGTVVGHQDLDKRNKAHRQGSAAP